MKKIIEILVSNVAVRFLRNCEKPNGSSLLLLLPNSHHEDRIASWEEKGERGHLVTCIISVKKLDDGSLLRLVNLPTFLFGGPFPPDPGTSINGSMTCCDITVETKYLSQQKRAFLKYFLRLFATWRCLLHGQILGARLAGVSATEISQLVGFSRGTVS
ncbi:hypothetical protein TNCV_3015571 [Trichonephila clavipes]|nr:hypothetical protein TNCV_3015571 [Trichonephila clavipes]